MKKQTGTFVLILRKNTQTHVKHLRYQVTRLGEILLYGWTTFRCKCGTFVSE